MSLEAYDFGLVGGDEGVATVVDLACYLVGVVVAPEVVADRDPIVSNGGREVTSTMGSLVHSGKSLERSTLRGPWLA